MKVTKIDNISLRESPVRYRRVYDAHAVIAHAGSAEERLGIEIAVEDTPHQGSVISVRFVDQPDYPVMPATRVVVEYLEALKARGEFD